MLHFFRLLCLFSSSSGFGKLRFRPWDSDASVVSFGYTFMGTRGSQWLDAFLMWRCLWIVPRIGSVTSISIWPTGIFLMCSSWASVSLISVWLPSFLPCNPV